MKIHDLLGVQPKDEFIFKGAIYLANEWGFECKAECDGIRSSCYWRPVSDCEIFEMIEKPELIKKIPKPWEPTESEKIIMRGMVELGYNWFAKDENDEVYFYVGESELSSSRACWTPSWSSNDLFIETDHFQSINSKTCYKCSDYI